MCEYKIVIVGAGGVGKSAIVTQFMQNQFSDEYDPTIEDTYRKHIIIDSQDYLLDILDTAGQEEYNTIKDQYMREGMGFLAVFGLDSVISLKELEGYITQIRSVKGDSSTPIIMVGNKCDIEQKVSQKDIEDMRKKFNIPIILTSAKIRKNVDETFETIVRMITEKNNESKKKTRRKEKKCSIL
uniref:GTPase HRas (Trinotate prediction) n=1 Tax=Henneguya salminicola TaxID=69463 RepID=A0A6G3MI69_HENSL